MFSKQMERNNEESVALKTDQQIFTHPQFKTKNNGTKG